MNYDCSYCKYCEIDVYEEPCSDCNEDDYGVPTKFVAYKSDAVQHPQHYNHGKYECIDVMVENFGKEAVKHFCLLNAFKYVWRTNYKNGVEDVRKAMKYLDFYLKLEGEANE